jgi:hypothetical protein
MNSLSILRAVRWFAFFLLFVQTASAADILKKMPSEIAEPGLTYGKSTELPKTILFTDEPALLVNDAVEWQQHGINAFFLNRIAREWSNDIWATDGKPWTIGAADATFQATQTANQVCQKIGADTFLKVAFDHPFDWFDEIAWQKINHNFRQFAIFARETGCTGIALDIEYISEQYDFNWPGYDFTQYSRQDLVQKIRARMTQVMQILYDEFPDMVFLTFPEQSLGLGAHIHVAWIEEAARRNAPGGLHYCTEHTYRNPNIRYMFGHAWACNDLFQRILSAPAREYWVRQCTIAAGVWPFGFNYQDSYAPGMDLPELRQGIAASLMLSPKYNWIYSHNCRNVLIGRDLHKYTGDADLKAYLKVLADREVVLDAKYVKIAQDLRAMKLRDYAAELGVRPVISFVGPDDTPRLTLMPAKLVNQPEVENTWALAIDYFSGNEIDLQAHFGTQKNWLVIGPFPNPGQFEGHRTVFAPEKKIDRDAEYPGVNGPVKWSELHQPGPLASVDLKKFLTPTDHVCAYALCYVTSPTHRKVQIRVGTNDAGKIWLGGKLIYDYPSEGGAMLDRDVVQTTLPAGTTPILLKICNGELNWGFVFRITDLKGHLMQDLQFSTKLPGK